MREDGGGGLSLDHGAGQEATPTNDVLLKELADYVTNVSHIHLLCTCTKLADNSKLESFNSPMILAEC